MSGWLREADFAQLLIRASRVPSVFDRFVHVDGPSMRYCLAIAYAEHGDLAAWLAVTGGQPERVVRQEIAANLENLDTLHRGQALHHDLRSAWQRTEDFNDLLPPMYASVGVGIRL